MGGICLLYTSSQQDTQELIRMLYAVPNGFVAGSRVFAGLTVASCNLASIKTQGNDFVLVHSLRSSVNSLMEDMVAVSYTHLTMYNCIWFLCFL